MQNILLQKSVNAMVENGNTPLVSVIVACYNAENYIYPCLSSILNQTYQNFEILVCDDCSTDSSYNILLELESKDDRIHVLRNDKNMFAAYARNRCFDIAKGDFFMIQDIDDYSEPNRIEVLLKNLMDSESIGFVSSSVKMFVDDPTVLLCKMRAGKEYPQKNEFLLGVPFFHPATMFKAACIKAVDGYRVAKETRRMEDYDLFMRLYAAGYKGKNIQEELYHYFLNY